MASPLSGNGSRQKALRREIAEKSQLLSDLEAIIADYQLERRRLVEELRQLKTNLMELENPTVKESNEK